MNGDFGILALRTHPAAIVFLQAFGVDIADDDVPADFKICSLLHVTAIEPLNAAATESN